MGIRSLSTASISTGTKRSKIWDQSAVYSPSSFESIATFALTSDQTSVTFSSIPSTYKHLQIRAIAQENTTNPPHNAALRFNSDSNNNYARHWLAGSGSAASSVGTASISYIEWGYLNGTTTSTSYSAAVIDILDYADTNKYKTVRMLQGYDVNGSGRVALQSGLWLNTAAITSITLASLATGLRTYSHFALYGIKG